MARVGEKRGKDDRGGQCLGFIGGGCGSSCYEKPRGELRGSPCHLWRRWHRPLFPMAVLDKDALDAKKAGKSSSNNGGMGLVLPSCVAAVARTGMW
ncbi:hypothetical protein E2562_009295 [Oryza meyeriana var. granulata]|uniref:Uncharacterized protein n=1 Tax=Oryza meyeriana var. granulata TaxID=110450 RepID=A0A6G1EAT2_9ORYZ|nr:hypothetical protein E2562_009295 [Oryza meyeriana var. granulata]